MSVIKSKPQRRRERKRGIEIRYTATLGGHQ
jgi:hypothetical protein